MSNDGGCPVILSEDVVPEVVLRNVCYVVCVIVGVAVFLSVTSQWSSMQSFLMYWGKKKKTPSSPLKMLNTDESDVNMPAVLCDLELIWALLWWRLQLPRRNKRFYFLQWVSSVLTCKSWGHHGCSLVQDYAAYV